MVARVCGWNCISDADDENFNAINCFYMKIIKLDLRSGCILSPSDAVNVNVLSPYVFALFVSSSSVHLSLLIKPEQNAFLSSKSPALPSALYLTKK
jgi:hypothetical protein